MFATPFMKNGGGGSGQPNKISAAAKWYSRPQQSSGVFHLVKVKIALFTRNSMAAALLGMREKRLVPAELNF